MNRTQEKNTAVSIPDIFQHLIVFANLHWTCERLSNKNSGTIKPKRGLSKRLPPKWKFDFMFVKLVAWKLFWPTFIAKMQEFVNFNLTCECVFMVLRESSTENWY